jgi:hypothetical protein
MEDTVEIDSHENQTALQVVMKYNLTRMVYSMDAEEVVYLTNQANSVLAARHKIALAIPSEQEVENAIPATDILSVTAVADSTNNDMEEHNTSATTSGNSTPITNSEQVDAEDADIVDQDMETEESFAVYVDEPVEQEQEAAQDEEVYEYVEDTEQNAEQYVESNSIEDQSNEATENQVSEGAQDEYVSSQV